MICMIIVGHNLHYITKNKQREGGEKEGCIYSLNWTTRLTFDPQNGANVTVSGKTQHVANFMKF